MSQSSWRPFLLALLLTCACALARGQNGPLPSEELAGLPKLRVQLKWNHQFQFAGLYAAIEQGYFRAAGLEVELVEGGPDIDPVAAVVAGTADFGIGNSALLLDFHAGRPVVAVAAIFQHSPFVILARETPAIRSVRDLSGRSLMSESHSAELKVYLKKAGLDLDRIRLIPHSGTTLSLAAPGQAQVDAMTAYISTEPFEAARHDIPYQIFNPRDLGINFYGDTLFTTRRMAQQQPQTVTAVRAALVAGWRYALAHPAEIVDLILSKYHSKMDRMALNLEAQAIYTLFQADVVDIGYMSRERWQHIGNTYAEVGMLPSAFSLDGFMFAPEEDLPPWVQRTLLWGAAAIVLGGLLTAYIVSLNLRLTASLKQLGTQAAELEAANGELARLSSTDALTGLYNRRHFDTALAGELNRAGRSGQPLSLLIVDVDEFKKYNDRQGHPVGDVCLQRVAGALRRNAQRGGEFAARIGGEEFAVVASNLDRAAAAALAARILADIAALAIPHPDSPCGHVTVSIGCSTCDLCLSRDADQLIAQADAALYQAKREGRNRCVAAA